MSHMMKMKNKTTPKRSYTYLASPYSHPNPVVRWVRYVRVCVKAGRLMQQGEHIFCPLAHSVTIGRRLGIEDDWEFWMEQDFTMLANASKMKVWMIDGWDISKGINREINFAKDLGIPIEYIT